MDEEMGWILFTAADPKANSTARPNEPNHIYTHRLGSAHLIRMTWTRRAQNLVPYLKKSKVNFVCDGEPWSSLLRGAQQHTANDHGWRAFRRDRRWMGTGSGWDCLALLATGQLPGGPQRPPRVAAAMERPSPKLRRLVPRAQDSFF